MYILYDLYMIYITLYMIIFCIYLYNAILNISERIPCEIYTYNV